MVPARLPGLARLSCCAQLSGSFSDTGQDIAELCSPVAGRCKLKMARWHVVQEPVRVDLQLHA